MLTGKHIVAIDDTHSILTFLRISLEALNARFSGAMTAAGGIALCESSPPDLVVLDLGLPDQEGLKILPKLKRLGKKGNLPVIVLTVRKERDARQMAAEGGADAYITKPFIMEELIETIQRMLGEDGAFGNGKDGRKRENGENKEDGAPDLSPGENPRVN